MGRHISRLLSDGITIIVGNFNHDPNRAANDRVTLGAKFTIWACKTIGATGEEAFCSIMRKDALSSLSSTYENYDALQAQFFTRLKEWGGEIPTFTS